MDWTPKHPAFQSILSTLAQEAAVVYVVGGAVRDDLLGNDERQPDLDLVVPYPAIPAARRAADRLGWAFYVMDDARDVARLVFMPSSPPLICDIASLRGNSIEEDLHARDFTINAMAYRLSGHRAEALIDPTGGQEDLGRRLVRRITAWSLAEDSIRLLRAVRFAVQLGFEVEEETFRQITRMSDTVRLASAERVRDELWKMMCTQVPDAALDLLRRYGLLWSVLPEIAAMEGVPQSNPHHLDVFTHTMLAVRRATCVREWLRGHTAAVELAAEARWQERLTPWHFRLREHFATVVTGQHLRQDWLVWYALLHDVGKPQTRTVEQLSRPAGEGEAARHRFIGHAEVGAALAAHRLSQLHFSRQEIGLAQRVVLGHLRVNQLNQSFPGMPLSRRAMYRYFRSTDGNQPGDRTGFDILLLALADTLARGPEPEAAVWDAWLDHAVQLLTYAFDDHGLAEAQRPLVDGHLVMQYLHLKPGREVGELLEHLQEAQAAGEITTAEEALALAAELMTERKD